MNHKTIIGIMGPGEGATHAQEKAAFELGQAIAHKGWVVLTGGRAAGVMDAASKGARAAGGLTIGIFPGTTLEGLSTAIDIPILTGMGSARNWINVLSCQVVIACGAGAGTISEAALAVKAGRPLIMLEQSPETILFFRQFTGKEMMIAHSVDEAVRLVNTILEK